MKWMIIKCPRVGFKDVLVTENLIEVTDIFSQVYEALEFKQYPLKYAVGPDSVTLFEKKVPHKEPGWNRWGHIFHMIVNEDKTILPFGGNVMIYVENQNKIQSFLKKIAPFQSCNPNIYNIYRSSSYEKKK